jgi:hypothetical protein
MLIQQNKKKKLAVALKITHFWSFSIDLVHCFALSLICEYRTSFDASERHRQWIMAVFYI